MARPGVRGADALGIRGFEESLPMALLRAREAVMRRFRPILAEHGLTEQQWRVLRALADAGDPISAGELADTTFLLGPSLSRMLAGLDDRGLVVRTVDATDGRRAEIAITAEGLALVAEIAPRSEAEYEALADEFGERRLRQLYQLLARLADA